MKLTEKLRALRQTDDKMHRQITEAFPPDWDMDAVLENSLRKYREHSENSTLPAEKPVTQKPDRRRILPHFSRGLATAACLAVAVGITGIGLYLQHTLSRTPVMQTEPMSTAVTAEQTTAGTLQSTALSETATTGGQSVTAEQTGSVPEQTLKTDTTPSVSGTSGSLSGQQTADSSGTTAGSRSGSQTTVTTSVTTGSTASSAQQSSSRQTGDETLPGPPGGGDGGMVGAPDGGFNLSHPGDGFARLTCSGSPETLRQDFRLTIRLSGYSLTEEQTANPEQERIYQLYGPWSSDPVRLSIMSYGSFYMRSNEKLAVMEPAFLGGSRGYIMHSTDASDKQGFIYVWDTGECVAVIAAGKEIISAYMDQIALNLTRY